MTKENRIKLLMTLDDKILSTSDYVPALTRPQEVNKTDYDKNSRRFAGSRIRDGFDAMQANGRE